MFSIVGCQIETIDLTHRQNVVLKLALLLYLAISTEPPTLKLEVEIRFDITVVVLTQQQAKKDSKTPISTLRTREVVFFPLPHCVGEMTPLLFGL